MLTYSCRRSHHSLITDDFVSYSCGGWGDNEQTKRTCEIYRPKDGWEKLSPLLKRPTVEHMAWWFDTWGDKGGIGKRSIEVPETNTMIPKFLLMSGKNTEKIDILGRQEDVNGFLKHYTR